FPADQQNVRPLLLYFCERAFNLRRSALLGKRKNKRDAQSRGGVPQDLPRRTLPPATHPQKCGLSCRRNGFFQDFQALTPDFDTRIEGDAGDIAAWPTEIGD